MKITFVMIVFNSDHVLEPCIKSVLPFGHVVSAEGPTSFWQKRGYTTSTDKTNDILEHYGIQTIHGQWTEKDDESNAAISLVDPDTDFVWVLDADEIWKSETIQGVIDLLSVGNIDSMSFRATSFYGGFDMYMTGFEENFEVHRIQRYYPGALFSTHRPPTIIAPDGRPWREHSRLNHMQTDAMGMRFYHYSYVFPSQMKYKTEYYAAMGGNIPDYYNRVYLPWMNGDSEERYRIEKTYDGVHNWTPERRGPCWTKRFDGEHPAEIRNALPELRERLLREMGEQ